MRKQFRTQMDLFVLQARADLVGAERQKAVELLQALLAEALSKSTSEQEAGKIIVRAPWAQQKASVIASSRAAMAIVL